MKILFFAFSTFFFANLTIAQTEKKAAVLIIPTNQERYQIDYELKDYVFIDGDSSILNQLNLDNYEQYRFLNENNEIFITAINQTLVLYPIINPNKGF